VKATIERYKKATSDNSSAAGTVAEVTIQVTSCRSVNAQYYCFYPDEMPAGLQSTF
jgi:hypothetical protein